MKGVSVIIASALIIVISVTAAFLALQYGTPALDRTKEIILMQEAKETLVIIDNAVTSVIEEGQGSTRNLRVTVSNGYYLIDTENEEVVFTMDTFAQIVGENVSKIENGINVTGRPGKVYLYLSLAFNVTGGGEFGRGNYNMIIRNEGYDSINQKQMISISI
jgi:hypothetical protein